MKTPLLDVSTQKLIDEESGKDLEMDHDTGIASITKGGIEYKINFRNRATPCVPGFETPVVQVVDKKQKLRQTQEDKPEDRIAVEGDTPQPKPEVKKKDTKSKP